MSSQYQEINEAIAAGNKCLQQIELVERNLRKARNWGYADIFTRKSLLSGIIKHDYLDDCQNDLNKLRVMIESFNKEVQDVKIVDNVSTINMSFATKICDFIFDGWLTDLIIQNKIEESYSQINNLKNNIQNIMASLHEAKNNCSKSEV